MPVRYCNLGSLVFTSIVFATSSEMVYSSTSTSLRRTTLLSFYLVYLLLEQSQEALPAKTLPIRHLLTRYNWAL